MVTTIGPRDAEPVVLRFGGGIHTRASEDEIDPRECAEGQNFLLDLQNREFRNRPPFDLIGTVPNAGEIRGFATLRKSDGTVTFLVQADDKIYKWDGLSTFTQVGTCSAACKLRGRLEHNWNLDDEVIITDLNLTDTVKKWDGTTLSTVSFTDENGSGFGNFYAKYCSINNERVTFANVKDASTATPHMVVGTKRGDYTQITVSNRPSSALSEQDPFFLLTPDLKSVNGFAEAFGATAISTQFGNMYILTGASAKDFAIGELFARSGAVGSEAVTNIGNDIVFGRQGRIESLIATERFGDVEGDDLSRDIGDSIDTYTGWTIVHNSRLQRTYCFPDEQSEAWVFFKPLREAGVSPWGKYVTAHSLAFRPTAVMNMLDPQDGLEYVFMGDSSGNLYRLEGTGSGDGGQNNVSVERLSKLFAANFDAEVYNVEGWVTYRKTTSANTLKIRIEYAGISVFNEEITITLPAASGAVFGGSYYFGGQVYFGVPFNERLTRQRFPLPGQSNEFQIRATVEGTTDFRVNEIGIRFREAST